MVCTSCVRASFAHKNTCRNAVTRVAARAFAWVAFLGFPALAFCANIDLQWDAATDDSMVSGYEVHYGLASRQYQWSVEANTNGAETNTKTVENLQAGNTYYFSVRSRNHDPSLVSAFSNEVSATIDGPADTTPPTVSLATTPAGSTYTEARSVSIDADATDKEGVSRVEFFDGDRLLGTDSVFPYSYTWAISSADNGDHELTAKAYDEAGNATTSSSLTRTVDIAYEPLAGLVASFGFEESDGTVWSRTPRATATTGTSPGRADTTGRFGAGLSFDGVRRPG